jgi:hypothetical protein
MRDNPKSAFNIESLSEELDTDVRMIQALVDMGYLDRDAQRIDTASREKLAKEFGESLKQMKEAAAFREAAKGAASYGMQRYGEKANKK